MVNNAKNRTKKTHFGCRDTLLQLAEVALNYEYKPLMPQAMNQMGQDKTHIAGRYTFLQVFDETGCMVDSLDLEHVKLSAYQNEEIKN